MARQPRVEILDAHGSLTAVSLNGRLFLDNVPTRFYKVLAAVFSRSGLHLALLTLDKEVVILTTDDVWQTYEQSALHHIPKRPSAVAFAPANSAVLVCDAFGDVYKLPVDDSLDLRQHVHTDHPCILGHFSTVTHIALTSTHIVTCDRDARIRISDYENPFVIHAFALGHADVVTSVLLRGQRVISAAADASLRLWNLDGLCLSVMRLDLPQHRPLFADVLAYLGKDTPTSITEPSPLVITSLHFHPLSRDIGLFTVLGGRAVYKVHGLVKGNLHHLDRLVACDDVISGMSVDTFERKVWVSLQGSRQIRWWRLVMHIQGIAHEVRTDSVEIGPNVAREWEHYSDVDVGRYDWLSKQRKNEMVDDWKGKKRRHVEI